MLEQRLTRWDAVSLALRRWPYLWASRQWGYAPSWWLRGLAAVPVTLRVLRSRTRFPIIQRFRFDDLGVEISTTQGTRRLDWTAFSGWIDLGIGWMLLGPRHELPVLRRGLAPAEAERLQALLGAHLVRQERPRR